MVLSASNSIARDIYFYTLQYRNLRSGSSDIEIPRKLLRSLGFNHHLIDCRVSPDLEYIEFYKRNTSMAHNDDWGSIAYGMHGEYPQDRVCIKGNCSEICRCFYYKTGKQFSMSSVEQLIELEIGWNSLPFIYDQLSDWYPQANAVAREAGVDILDLFYWEHRMGSWQAQRQLEWDIIQEAYTPFNHRALLEIMLGVSSDLRCAPDYILYERMIQALWPECMNQPINPPQTVKDRVKNVLLRLGLIGITERIYRGLGQ